MRNHLFIGAALAALVAPAAVHAQETTSAIRGVVTENGTPVAGATVTAIHVPTGTRASTTTTASGAFTLSGLRPGGPFTVTVNGTQFQVTDIYTVVAQPYDLPIEMASVESGQGQDIVVSASSITGARSLGQGPATVLTAEDVQNVATVNRDVRDLMRRDPFARLQDTPGGGRAVSFAGQNARFNRFSVDGVAITDSFGLNPDGLPSRRSPIPLDAIGQFQTKVAPYDVREGNFQGGAINIVLKSGTNDFSGTGFYAYSSDELTGKKTKAGPGVPTGRVTLPNFKIENYGVQLSGPIIQDRLFFMVAGERIRAGRPIAEGPSDNNAGTAIPTLTQAQVDKITQIAESRYGFKAGGVVNNNQDKDDRLVAKLDANLSDTQRASLTYTYAKDSIILTNNTSSNPGAPSLGLASNAYVQGNRLHTGVVQLNSDWSDSFSTEVRGFYKNYRRIQDPLMGRGFAEFIVCAADQSDRSNPGAAGAGASTNCAPGSARVAFGPDVSRQFNALSVESFGGLVQGRVTLGDHDFRVFGEFQHAKTFNAFLSNSSNPRTGITGSYYFDSIADFAAGTAQRFGYINSVTLNPDDAAAQFAYNTFTVGMQDTWRMTDTLTFAYGFRYDTYGGGSRPALNQNFLNRFGFPNTVYISGLQVIQPRFGVEWKPAPRLSVRGGAGIFAGGTPDVYVSNSFSNTGVLSNQIDIIQQNNGTFTGATTNPAIANQILTNVNGNAIPAAANQLLQNVTTSTTSPTNSLAPNFKLPSQWRATLSVDYDADLGPLGDGWQLGADFFYSGVRNQVLFTDIRSIPTAARTPDGRVRYTSATTFSDTAQDIQLTNTKLGRSYIGVARVRKAWDFGLDAGLSFTYQDIKDQAPATSSTAGSNYSNGAFLDANRAAYGTSNDQVKYQFKYDLTYSRAFFGDYKTTIALFGETRIGQPYSYTFQDTASGRSAIFGTGGSNTRYLLYVPTGINDPLVSYSSADFANQFDQFIESTGLSKYRGKIAPRNAFNSKWFTRIDLHVEQEVPAPFLGGKSRFSIFADVENFTNLLNSKWGQIREYAFPYNAVAARVQCLQAPAATGAAGTATANTGQACAQYRYSAPNAAPSDTIYSAQSLYAIRVGARFSF